MFDKCCHEHLEHDAHDLLPGHWCHLCLVCVTIIQRTAKHGISILQWSDKLQPDTKVPHHCVGAPPVTNNKVICNNSGASTIFWYVQYQFCQHVPLNQILNLRTTYSILPSKFNVKLVDTRVSQSPSQQTIHTILPHYSSYKHSHFSYNELIFIT